MKTIFLFCFLVCVVSSFGQVFDVKYSATIADLPRAYILPVEGGGFIGMKKEDKIGYGNWNKHRRIFTFLLFDKNMLPVKEMLPADKGFSFSVFFSEFKKVGNRYWLFYIEPAEKNAVGDLKAVEVNPVSLELGTPKTLATSDVINLDLKFFSGLTNLWSKMKSSPDGNRIGFAVSTGKPEFFVTCFDENLNVLWSRTEINQLPNQVKVTDFETDNTGTVYMALTEGEKGYVNVLNASIRKLLKVETGTGRLYDVYLLAQPTTQAVIVAGMYYEGTKNIAGVYKASIRGDDPTLSDMQRNPFPEKIVALFDSDGWGSVKDNKYGIEPGFLSQLIAMPNGSTAFVAEKKQIIGHVNITVLHSGPILTVCFGAKGATFNRLPKYNVAAGTYWKHFYAYPAGNKLVVFYNDNPVNISKDITESPKQVNIEDNSVLVAAVVDPDGGAERILPINTGEKYEGIAEYLQPISESTLAVPLFQKKKKNVYAALSIR